VLVTTSSDRRLRCCEAQVRSRLPHRPRKLAKITMHLTTWFFLFIVTNCREPFYEVHGFQEGGLATVHSSKGAAPPSGIPPSSLVPPQA
jgi:hypothetical protein